MTISKEVRVGLFMVVSLVLLYLGFNYLKGIDFFSSRNKYYAIYDNVDQLMPSNQVYVSGVSVGRVSNIIIQQNKDRVVVELDISSKVILGDSAVAILNGDFLGNKFVQLTVGNINKPIKPKDTIQSAVAKGITTFLEENAAPVTDNLQLTLRKLNTILDNLANNSKKIDKIFDDLRGTPTHLNNALINANDRITALTDSLQLLSRNVNRTIRSLDPTLRNFKTFSDSLKVIEVNNSLKKMNETLVKVNETLEALSAGDNTASKLLTEDSLYVNLNRMIQSIDSLAVHFNENPKHFMAPLGKSRKKIQRDLEKRRKEESN